MAENMEKRISQYVALRDHIEQMEKQHAEQLKQPKDTLQKLGGIIQKFLDDNKLENLKTAGGTAYVSVRYTASLSDPDAFMRFVIDTKNFDLLERRASSTACRQFVEDHNGQLPAGVNLNALSSIGVRRPPGHPKS